MLSSQLSLTPSGLKGLPSTAHFTFPKDDSESLPREEGGGNQGGANGPACQAHAWVRGYPVSSCVENPGAGARFVGWCSVLLVRWRKSEASHSLHQPPGTPPKSQCFTFITSFALHHHTKEELLDFKGTDQGSEVLERDQGYTQGSMTSE